MVEIFVIVVNWNGKQFLETCLTALRRQTLSNFKTVLVDNGSSDGSADYVRINFPEVEVIALQENRGFTGGNIAAWEAIRRQTSPDGLIVLLNNDTEADPLWLDELYKASRSYPSAGCFASKMMMFDRRGIIDNCGFSLTSAGFTVDLGRGGADSEIWGEPRQAFGPCGGAAAYRVSMLENIGFLDDSFFMISEDVDLSFRGQLRGHECWMIPSAIVYHRYRASITRFPTHQEFFGQRNAEFFYWKNMPANLVVQFLPLRLLYQAGAAIYFLRLGMGWTFLSAKVDFFKHLPRLLRKRLAIQESRTITTSQLKRLLRKTPFSSKCRKLFSVWTSS